MIHFRLPFRRSPIAQFHSFAYLRHTARRLEHLASLGLPIAGRTVLELGAGIGDHTHFFLDRGCSVVATDSRPENLAVLKRRYPTLRAELLDLEDPNRMPSEVFEVVHCYGLLYHLHDPAAALRTIASLCSGILLLETCVSFGNALEIGRVREDARNPSQASSGWGCRPTRPWILAQLREQFPYVYTPHTQPVHEEFPTDWTRPGVHGALLARAVFIASREPLSNAMLAEGIREQQQRQL